MSRLTGDRVLCQSVNYRILRTNTQGLEHLVQGEHSVVVSAPMICHGVESLCQHPVHHHQTTLIESTSLPSPSRAMFERQPIDRVFFFPICTGAAVAGAGKSVGISGRPNSGACGGASGEGCAATTPNEKKKKIPMHSRPLTLLAGFSSCSFPHLRVAACFRLRGAEMQRWAMAWWAKWSPALQWGCTTPPRQTFGNCWYVPPS